MIVLLIIIAMIKRYASPIDFFDFEHDSRVNKNIQKIKFICKLTITVS